MKVVLYTAITISDSSRAILYDEATELALNGHDVTVVYCGGLMNMCWKNMDRDREVCLSCIFKQDQIDQIRISPKVKFLSLKEFWMPLNVGSPIYQHDYSTVEDIKNLRYKDVNIGLASLSSYISISRNLDPNIDQSFRDYFDTLLKNCVLLTDAFSHLVKELKPDLIYAYNGRMIDSRPIWEIAESLKISFRVLEAQYTYSKIKKMYFSQASCFSIPELTKYIKNAWSSSNLLEQEKERIGGEFFRRRRNSMFAGDKIYTLNQELGTLPDSWDHSKRNITIFISSEDEFAAVGDEFDRFALYPSQLQGIKDILSQFDYESIHFYIRIHPNLSDVNYSYHNENYELAKFQNATIIEPHSKISSYALVDNSSVVIVFGSTVGIEAVFWEKPVILLAGAIYYNLEGCYIPKNQQELYDLIRTPLKPLPKTGAYMYGFVYNDNVGQDCRYVDCNVTSFSINLLGLRREFMVNNWNKLLGSKFIYYVFMLFAKLFFRIRLLIKGNPKLVIPTKERTADYNKVVR